MQHDFGGICQAVSLVSDLHHYQAGGRSVCLFYFTLWCKLETMGGVAMLVQYGYQPSRARQWYYGELLAGLAE